MNIKNEIGWSKPNEGSGGGESYDDTAIKEEISNIKNDIADIKTTDEEIDQILIEVFGNEYLE